MGALISFLLLPILIILILFLFFGIVVYVKARNIWYQMTGRKPKDGSSFHFNTGSGAAWNGSQNSQQAASGNASAKTSGGQSGQKKIFSKDEGEYVDFEMVE